MFAKDFDFDLPDHLIAQEPADKRDHSRLLYADGSSTYFSAVVDHIDDCDVMFFNNTQVIRARIALSDFLHIRGDVERVRNTGEIFFVSQKTDTDFEALVSPGKYFRVGDVIFFHDRRIEVVAMTTEGRLLRLCGGGVGEWFESYGNLPLPPYIAYDPSKEDRYQTVFAHAPGALAAPTASLHFTTDILDHLSAQGVDQYQLTLHVGLGTFKHIDPNADAQSIELHDEEIVVPVDIFEIISQISTQEKRILAVGTTVVRTIESLPALYLLLPEALKKGLSPSAQKFWGALAHKMMQINLQFQFDRRVVFLSYDEHTRSIRASTKIFIYPGYQFLLIDRLITNFHLPKSSLLMLVCAFAGKDQVLSLYEQAVREGFRFFSFGDAMLLDRDQ